MSSRFTKITRQLSSIFLGLESRPSDTSTQTHLLAGGVVVGAILPMAQPQDWMSLLCSQEQLQHICSQCFLGVPTVMS